MLNTYVNLPANPDTDLLDVSTLGNHLGPFPVLKYTSMSATCAEIESLGASWIADVEWSNNGVDWFAFPTPAQIGPGAGFYQVTGIDLTDVAFVRVIVTTIEAGITARIGICMKGGFTLDTFTTNEIGPLGVLIPCAAENLGQFYVLPCLRFSKMSATASSHAPAAVWGRESLALDWSNNNVDWFGLTSDIATLNRYDKGVDISFAAFVRFRVSDTATNGLLRLAVCMKSTS